MRSIPFGTVKRIYDGKELCVCVFHYYLFVTAVVVQTEAIRIQLGRRRSKKRIINNNEKKKVQNQTNWVI